MYYFLIYFKSNLLLNDNVQEESIFIGANGRFIFYVEEGNTNISSNTKRFSKRHFIDSFASSKTKAYDFLQEISKDKSSGYGYFQVIASDGEEVYCLKFDSDISNISIVNPGLNIYCNNSKVLYYIIRMNLFKHIYHHG